MEFVADALWDEMMDTQLGSDSHFAAGRAELDSLAVDTKY